MPNEKELIIRIKGDGAPLKAAAMVAVEELRRVDKENATLNAKREKENKRLLEQILKDQQKANEEAIREAKKLADAQAREARKAAEAQAREELAKAREAKKSADVAEREAKRAADAQAREAKKAADQFTREEEKKAREAKRTADIAEREAKRAAEAQAKEAKKTFDANFVAFQAVQSSAIDFTAKQGELAKKRREAAEKEIRKTEEAEKKKIKQVLTDEEVSLLARNKAVQASNQKRIDAAHEAMTGEKKGFESSLQGAMDLKDQVLSLAGQFLALGAAGQAMRSITDDFVKAKEAAANYGKELIKQKEDLKELAVLRGLAFASDEFVKEIGQFSMATNLAIPEADKFQRQVYGSSAGGLQKGNIDEATLKLAMVEAGRTAARQTTDYGTRGDLIGSLTQFRKYSPGAAGSRELNSDAEKVRLGLTEGRGDDAPLTKSLLNVSGSLVRDGGMVGSLPELAAVLGVTSETAGPGMADTRTEQLVRGLRGSTPQQGQFLKGFAGINENDNLETRLDKMVPKLREMRAKGRDIPTFLMESGMNEEQTRALSEMEPNYEKLKMRLQRARQGAADTEQQNADFAKTPQGRMRAADAALAVTKLEKGQTRQSMEILKKEAEDQLTKEDFDTNPTNLIYGRLQSLFRSGGSMSGRDIQIQDRALKLATQRSGIPAPQHRDWNPLNLFSATGPSGVVQGAMNGDFAFSDMSGRANMLDNLRVQKEQLDELRKQSNVLRGAFGTGFGVGAIPPPLPAAPAPAMKRS